MIPPAGQPIVTAAAMRALEAAHGDLAALMEQAGTAVAHATRRLAGGADVLIACGPGNNGGDGYVAARVLAAAGVPVRVAAAGEPRADLARAARARWAGPVEPLADAAPAPVLLDALFGTGLARALDPALAAPLSRLAAQARLAIAVDLPSGVETDSGAVLGTVPRFAVTLALGALKPGHVLYPGADRCGAVRVLDIGLPVEGAVRVLDRPRLAPPAWDAHKYTRGMVVIIAGAMDGAARLASRAAMRAGAGYVLLAGGEGGPDALVRRPWSPALLADERIGAVVIGPGLGRDEAARARLDAVLGCGHPAVIDGDALHLVAPDAIAARAAPTILTPHAGEFRALFGAASGEDGGKIGATRAAARTARAVVVHKGADTVIAAPDGRVAVHTRGSPWLSTAGTGDVLAGAIGAMLAATGDAFGAAGAGVWLHGEAARRAGAAFIADDLVAGLSGVRALL